MNTFKPINHLTVLSSGPRDGFDTGPEADLEHVVSVPKLSLNSATWMGNEDTDAALLSL